MGGSLQQCCSDNGLPWPSSAWQHSAGRVTTALAPWQAHSAAGARSRAGGGGCTGGGCPRGGADRTARPRGPVQTVPYPSIPVHAGAAHPAGYHRRVARHWRRPLHPDDDRGADVSCAGAWSGTGELTCHQVTSDDGARPPRGGADFRPPRSICGGSIPNARHGRRARALTRSTADPHA